ncbi:hypothetical protein GCM10022225_84180 [Plantactinospora mayteni]|uniref:TniQ domain-containing protein n=1 Tax=Plantactinospora mayteni TaxID=566021 RepID=A0ABQ4F4J8_9ACTN|nr:hypothetical protein Pma05_84170 [Plantactinospora mayteni]
MLTGLCTGKSGQVASSRMLFTLDADRAAAFAHATRLTAEEVDQLTLASLAGRYPPFDLAFLGRYRQTHGIFIKENWVLTRSTRYCPRCLAGDGSIIQQRHGGAWSRLWRLPVVFACTTHRRLLRHTCPSCGTPVHQRAAGSISLLPASAQGGMHPAACRHPRDGRSSATACGYRLDTPTASGRLPRGWGHHEMLAFQQRLLDLLGVDGPTATVSVGTPTTPGGYFADLRIVSCLLAASWPAGRELITEPVRARVLDGHANAARRRLKATRVAGHPVRPAAVFDKPPLHPGTCAALFTLADRVLTAGEPDAVRLLLRPLVEAAPFIRDWIKRFITDDGPCSRGLQLAIGTEVGAQHVIDRVGIPRRAPQPPPRQVLFGPQHIPQYLPTEWHNEYFSLLAGYADEQFLRRAVPILLARTSAGGGIDHTGRLLGLPPRTAKYAIGVVSRQLRDHPRRRATLNTGLDALTTRLNNTTGLIDYGRRRRALRTWTMSPDQWHQLTADLIGRPVSRKSTLGTDWGDRKRILASVWIWTRVTQGERYFAPLVRPNHNAPRPGGQTSIYVHARWPALTAEHGNYAELRHRLNDHADQLAAEIDERRTEPPR